MSVIVAIKNEDVIYMGCDTLTSTGNDKEYRLQESAFKISKLQSGMLVGICGNVVVHQCLCADESIFDIEGDTLTKKDIVNNIIPRIKERLYNMTSELTEPEEMPISIIVAYKDKMFRIFSYYLVLGIEDYCAIGAGSDYTFASLSNKDLQIRERVVGGLKTSAKYSIAVSKPFVLIDTKNLEYEIVEM